MLSLYDISYITVHSEVKDYEKYLDMIKGYGIRCGISVNPDTDITTIFDELEKGADPGRRTDRPVLCHRHGGSQRRAAADGSHERTGDRRLFRTDLRQQTGR